MKIESSTISMGSTRSYQAESEVEQTNITRRYDGMGQKEGTVTGVNVSQVRTSVFEGSESAAVYSMSSGSLGVGDLRESGNNNTRVNVKPAREKRADNDQNAAWNGVADSIRASRSSKDWLSGMRDAIDNDPTIQMLRKCLELLARATGKPISENTRVGGRKVGDYLRMSEASASYRQTMASFGSVSIGAVRPAVNIAPPVNAGLTAPNQNPNGYWTRQTIQSGFVRGVEHTAFSSTGTAVTSDGRTIDFGITVEMSRSFEMAVDLVGKEQAYTDPLVINLDTDAASLADVSFYFDLDADGRAEKISSLGEGSGFLAMDRNGDGKINDGSELFGAMTGDGFAELARFDEDGNGWIDENDSVFSKLKVWVKCGEGVEKLLSLSEADVGAIFLGSQSTQFTLDDSYGSEGGAIRRTGVYLKESGSVGTVQHVDFKA